MLPVHVLPLLSRSNPSEHRHLGPDNVFTHMCWQFRVEQGSVNGRTSDGFSMKLNSDFNYTIITYLKLLSIYSIC